LGGLKIQNSIAINKNKPNTLSTTNRGRDKIKEYNQFLKNKYDNLENNKGLDESEGFGNYMSNNNTEVINLKSGEGSE